MVLVAGGEIFEQRQSKVCATHRIAHITGGMRIAQPLTDDDAFPAMGFRGDGGPGAPFGFVGCMSRNGGLSTTA